MMHDDTSLYGALLENPSYILALGLSAPSGIPETEQGNAQVILETGTRCLYPTASANNRLTITLAPSESKLIVFEPGGSASQGGDRRDLASFLPKPSGTRPRHQR